MELNKSPNTRKILVTGAGGMLGSLLITQLSDHFDVKGYDHNELDITNSSMVISTLKNQRPDVIIHTAALTNVEYCETNPKEAYLINTQGTQNLVNWCIGEKVLFVYISSTGIYGTSKTNNFNEFDKVCPTTIHHKSKYEGEQAVINHLSNFLILRTGWLYGGKVTHKKNFIYNRYKEATGCVEMFSNQDQIGNPTYVGNLVKQIHFLIESDQRGIFNCVDKAENVSRFEYVKSIINLFGLECEVKGVNNDFFKRVAPVSDNESAENFKLDLLGINVMQDWKTALEKYIEKIKEELNG